jgi:hypothetical protein
MAPRQLRLKRRWILHLDLVDVPLSLLAPHLVSPCQGRRHRTNKQQTGQQDSNSLPPSRSAVRSDVRIFRCPNRCASGSGCPVRHDRANERRGILLMAIGCGIMVLPALFDCDRWAARANQRDDPPTSQRGQVRSNEGMVQGEHQQDQWKAQHTGNSPELRDSQ